MRFKCHAKVNGHVPSKLPKIMHRTTSQPGLGSLTVQPGLMDWVTPWKWNFCFPNIEHMFKPAASSVSISARNTAAVWEIRKSWAAWPISVTPRAPQGEALTCSPSCVPYCIEAFILTLHKDSVGWPWNAVTYLRWLPGQITADLTHPDISEGSLCPAFAAAPLPPSLPACMPCTAFTLQLWHTRCIFGGLELAASYFSQHPQSFPRRPGLTSVLSVQHFNLLKNQTVLLGWEGGPAHRCTNTYHATHVTVTQLKKCLQWGTSLKGLFFFSIIHDIFKLLNFFFFFYQPKYMGGKY